MNFKQKIVNEINFFDKKVVKIVFDVLYISKEFNFEKIFSLKFQKIIQKKNRLAQASIFGDKNVFDEKK